MTGQILEIYDHISQKKWRNKTPYLKKARITLLILRNDSCRTSHISVTMATEEQSRSSFNAVSMSLQ